MTTLSTPSQLSSPYAPSPRSLSFPSPSNCLPQLIKGLALYEKAPELVFATEELLRRNLLGEGGGPLAGRYAETMLAYVGGGPQEGGQAIAMALYLYVSSPSLSP